jgi:hypothetical protein
MATLDDVLLGEEREVAGFKLGRSYTESSVTMSSPVSRDAFVDIGCRLHPTVVDLAKSRARGFSPPLFALFLGSHRSRFFFRVFFHECCQFIPSFFLIGAVRLSVSEKPALYALHHRPLFLNHLSILRVWVGVQG